MDLSSHADIKRVTAEILAKHPRIDYLFNNAGVLTETLQFSGHGNELHFEINTLAPLQLIDALRPALRSAGGAFVVNTTAGLRTASRSSTGTNSSSRKNSPNFWPLCQIQTGAERPHGRARPRNWPKTGSRSGPRTPAPRKRR